jgi:hypothetical protein
VEGRGKREERRVWRGVLSVERREKREEREEKRGEAHGGVAPK